MSGGPKAPRRALLDIGVRRRLLLVLLGLVATFALIHGDYLRSLDYWLYDQSLNVRSVINANQPADDRVVVVAIDQASLSEIGHWPWSRAIHAEAVRRLARAGAKGIAYNVIFSEAHRNDPDGDAELASAIAEHGNVVLPVSVERPRRGGAMVEVPPLPMLAEAAQTLGHVDTAEEHDGYTRGIFLRAGLGGAHWSTLALALLEGEQRTPPDELPGVALPDAGPFSPQLWIRDRYIMLPYSGPAGTFGHISFTDLFNDRVPDHWLRDRWVLVGVTASGHGGVVATPLNKGKDRKPGVEFNAHVLKTLLDRSAIVPTSRPLHMAIAAAFILLPLLLSLVAPLRNGLVAIVLSIGLLLVTTAVLLFGFRLWQAPAAPLAVLAAGLLPLIFSPVRQWRRMANEDSLTGLANRYCYNRLFEREWATAVRAQRPLALLLIDVDRFKQFNDRYGHQRGDQVLSQIAQEISKAARRPRDLATRLGGEEFALLLPETDRMSAWQVAERVRKEIFALDILHADAPDQRLSVSIGIHAITPPRGASMSQLYDDADKALYQAKKQGRNTSYLYAST